MEEQHLKKVFGKLSSPVTYLGQQRSNLQNSIKLVVNKPTDIYPACSRADLGADRARGQRLVAGYHLPSTGTLQTICNCLSAFCISLLRTKPIFLFFDHLTF